MNATTPTTSTALVEARPPRSILTTMAHKYGMEPQAFEATLRATVCKGNISREEFAAGLVVCRQYNLNPLLKEIYFFPAKGGGVQPVVSVDGWSRIINDHEAFDGMEFEDFRENGELIAVTCKMFRKDRSRPTSTTEYMTECRRSTDVWKQWPARMLRHKAMIQAARYAFGFSGIVDQDEYERITSVQNIERGTGMLDRYENRAKEAAPNGGFNAENIGAGLDQAKPEDPPHDPATGEIRPEDTDAQDADFTDAVNQPSAERWAEGVTEMLAADHFKSEAEIDDFVSNEDNGRYFGELEQINKPMAVKLNAMIMGKRKALKSKGNA